MIYVYMSHISTQRCSKTKNKTKSIIIIIAIIILSTSTIQAKTIKNETENKIAENIEDDEESSCLGCIY